MQLLHPKTRKITTFVAGNYPAPPAFTISTLTILRAGSISVRACRRMSRRARTSRLGCWLICRIAFKPMYRLCRRKRRRRAARGPAKLGVRRVRFDEEHADLRLPLRLRRQCEAGAGSARRGGALGHRADGGERGAAVSVPARAAQPIQDQIGARAGAHWRRSPRPRLPDCPIDELPLLI